MFGGLIVCGLCGHTTTLTRMLHELTQLSARANTSVVHFKQKDSLQGKGTSDVEKLGPFIFNYISNLVKTSKSKKLLHSVSNLEQILTQTWLGV